MFQVPLVMLQCSDECVTMNGAATRRFLNTPNPRNSGCVHGIFPCRAGVEIRLLSKVDGKLGLVQDTVAAILDFEFEQQDREECMRTGAGKGVQSSASSFRALSFRSWFSRQ